jgi:hypothetical protein
VFTEPLASNDRGIHGWTLKLSFHTIRTPQKTTRPRILPLLRVFDPAVTFLPSRCLATYTYTQIGDIYEVHRSDGTRCHDIHTKFHKDWFRNSKVDMGGFTDTQTACWPHKPILLFLKSGKLAKNLNCSQSVFTYMFHMKIGINHNFSFNIIKWLVLKMERQCVFSEVGTEFPDIIKRFSRFKGLTDIA